MFELNRTLPWENCGNKRVRGKQRRPALELLEAREVPATLVGLTTTNQLAIFDSGSPGSIATIVPLTGLLPGETMVGIDVRPLNGVLYGLGSSSRLYRININNGVVSPLGSSTFSPSLNGAYFGFDINPFSDLARVVSNTGQNLRIDPTSGVVDGPNNTLAAFPSLTPSSSVVAIANTNDVAGATSTTLYGIDSNDGELVEIGGPDGNPSPNLGAVTEIGSLGIPTTANAGFYIAGAGTGTAYATLSPASGGSELVTINLATGAASLVGAIGDNLTLRGLTALQAGSNQALGGSIHFSQAIYSVSQSSPTAVITIVRDGSNLGAATVNFATLNGTAQAGLDYTPVNETVNFAAGQATTTVAIGIDSRPLPAGNVSLNLALSNPTDGATLGSPSSALLTILESGVPVAPGNDANAAWLSQVYKDLLGRTIDPGGLAYWESLLDQPFVTRFQVAYGIASSLEYKVHFIQVQYLHYFGTLPDPLTLSSQLQLMLNGGTDEITKATMLGSPTLFQLTGSNRAQFINFLYLDLLGRPVDPAALLVSSTALATGLTNGQLAIDVAVTPEAQTATVARYYQTLLRQSADAAGLTYYSNLLQRGLRDEVVIASLVSSDEYYQDAQAGF